MRYLDNVDFKPFLEDDKAARRKHQKAYKMNLIIACINHSFMLKYLCRKIFLINKLE